jgi:hypothetical protein
MVRAPLACFNSPDRPHQRVIEVPWTPDHAPPRMCLEDRALVHCSPRTWWHSAPRVGLGYTTPVNVSETVHSRRCNWASWDLAMTAVLACAELVGVGRELLEMTVDYVTKRVQFGKPVGAFQAVKHRCADMRIGVQASTAATCYAAMAVDAQTADWRRAVSIAKAYASNTINDVAGEALQLHGGIGFTWEHDLHLYLRRARANSLLYGDSRYHREVLCSAAAEATSPDQAAAIARDCDDVRRHPCPQSIREKGVLNGAPRRGRGPAHALDFAPHRIAQRL